MARLQTKKQWIEIIDGYVMYSFKLKGNKQMDVQVTVCQLLY